MSLDISSTKRSELCVEAQLHLGEGRGAKVQTNEKVLTIKTHGFNEGVSVTTDRAVYGADKLIIAAGSWVRQFLDPSHARHFKVYRQVMFWFKIRDDLQSQFLPGEFPIFIWYQLTPRLFAAIWSANAAL